MAEENNCSVPTRSNSLTSSNTSLHEKTSVKKLQNDETLLPRREEEDSIRQKGIVLALALADEIWQQQEIQNWELPFLLARRLRLLTEDQPERFEEAVLRFSEKLDYAEFEEVWVEMLLIWDDIKVADGEDALRVAMKHARRRPFPLQNSFGESYAAVASLAWHLSLFMEMKPFFLPRERIGEWLDISSRRVSSVVSLLEKKEVIFCIDPSYSYKDHKAKTYRFIGKRKP
jgi:hypothetical protein